MKVNYADTSASSIFSSDRRAFLKRGAAAIALSMIPAHSVRAQSTAPHAGSIDVHAHWTPEPYVRALAELGRPAFSAGTGLNPLMFDLEKRLKWMDERNVQMHVLTLSGSMPWQWTNLEQSVRLARLVNDAGIQAHITHPDRFLLGAAIPIRFPEAALSELNRVAGKPGVRAVGIPNSIEGNDYLFGPEYLPFLARCEELGYPLLFHPLDGAPNYYGGPERLGGPSFIYNTLGFPFEHATTAAKFIINGHLDRFPKLNILLAHAGGSFPYIAGRIEYSMTHGASKVKLQRPFSEYVRRFHYDTLTYSPAGLRFLIETVGIDRIVIGTDVYAVMNIDQPNAMVEQLNLPASDLDLVLRTNANRLLRMESTGGKRS